MDERRRRELEHIRGASSFAEAVRRAAVQAGAQVYEHQAALIAEAVSGWYDSGASCREMAPRHLWEVADFRDHLRQGMRWKLLDLITREGRVPVALPSETLRFTSFPFGSADLDMPEASDWTEVVVTLSVGTRTPPVDRRAAVRAGILSGDPS